MSKEQIEEMAKDIDDIAHNAYIENYDDAVADSDKIAKALYNAGYRKQEWISVDERLPEREGKYLVYTIKGGIKFGDYRSYLVGEGKLCEPQFDYYVTHWMPLPEPPKMKEETAKTFFSPYDVSKMTPKEVRENYQAIRDSMKEWK